MKLIIKKGSTSVTLYLFLQDSASTSGAGKTGIAYNTASLTAYYVRPLGSATSITLATQTVTGAWSSGGFVEVDATNMPGWYRFDLPDAVLATGVNSAGVHFKGASGMAPLPIEVQLVAYDPQDSVRLGLTALPNATAGASNGLPLAVDSSGRVDVLKINGTSQTARDLGASVLLSSGTGTGQVSLSSGAVTVGTNNDKTGYGLSSAAVQAVWDALTSALTTVGSIGKLLVDNVNATISSRSTYAGGDTSGTTTLLSRIGGAITISGGKVAATLASTDVTGNVAADLQTIKTQAVTCAAGVTVLASVGTAATSTAQTGDAYARLGAPAGASVSADVAAVKTDSAAIKLKTDNLPSSPAAVGSAMTLTSAYDPAKTAAQAGDAMTLTSAYDAAKTALTVGGYTAPDNSGIAAIQAKTDNLPDDPADASDIATSFSTVSANLSTLAGYVDTEVAAIKAKTDNLPANPVDVSDLPSIPAVPTAAENADALLGRNLAGGSDGGRTVQDALRILRNKVVISGGTITVYEEDDTTIAYTGTLTTDSAAVPITGVDPA